MIGMPRKRNNDNSTEQALIEADSIALQRIDEASATPRPSTIGRTYVEDEYAAQGDEQEQLFTAEGENHARPHAVRAQGLAASAGEAAYLATQHRGLVQQAQEQYQHAARTLTVFTRRDRFAVVRYVTVWLVLVLGDTAGVLGAAITLGEIPLVALGQALATGFAAVTAGQAGADLKDLRMARQRQRDPDELTEDEQHYRQLFTGLEAGVSIMKMVGWTSLTIVLIVTAGIFSLRLAVEGMVAGAAFGALAAATALASFISTYGYTDDVSDLLRTIERNYRKAVREHTKLDGAQATRQLAEASETARSVRAEYAHRGLAARARIKALCQRVLRNNPGVVGHGPVAEEPDVIGRRVRRDAA